MVWRIVILRVKKKRKKNQRRKKKKKMRVMMMKLSHLKMQIIRRMMPRRQR